MMTLRNFLALTCLVSVCWASPFVGSVGPSSEKSQTLYKECTNDDGCGQNECCSLEPNRYSIPSCKPRRLEGEICRPGKYVTLNSTLTYPDGRTIKMEEVHYAVCPCANGLVCQRSDSSCARPTSTGSGFNQLTEFEETKKKN